MSGFERDVEELESRFDQVTADVDPEELRYVVVGALESSDHTPALLCLLSSHISGSEAAVEQAAGLQLVHAGLDVIRDLLDDPSTWRGADLEPEHEDMELLAADVLVTLGFRHLVEEYEHAARIINEFGKGRARMAEVGGEERVPSGWTETYRAAVEVGYDGEPPGFLLEFAEAIARKDACEGYVAEPEVSPEAEQLRAIWDGDSAICDYLQEITAESGAVGGR